MTKAITYLNSIDDLIQKYRYFLVDQFGVLHDGYNAFPGAADALRRLKSAGAKVIIISNSGKRADSNVKRMRKLGFGEDCFDQLVSSGEVAWHLLRSKIIGTRVASGVSTYFLANDTDRSAIVGLELSETDNIHDAGLFLLTGQLLDEEGLRCVCERLKPAVTAGVLCICTNPDKIAYGVNGKAYSAGTVAQWYQDNGGEVIWLGKPHPEIYEYIFTQYNISDKREVVCIGDSVEHDIDGGVKQGMDTLLVRTGIYDNLSAAELQMVYETHKAWPDFVIDALRI